MSFKIEQFNERTQRKIRAQLDADIQSKNPRQVTQLESNSCNAPLEKKKVQRQTGERFLVRVATRRKRLIDESNLCYKYHEDLCRYAGALPSDAPQVTHSEVSQTKCKKGESEEITIEVIQFPNLNLRLD